MERVVVVFEAKTGDAIREIGKVEDALDQVSDSAKDATGGTKGLGEEVRESGAAISLLDAATGGLASRVRDTIEVYKQFRGRITAVTAAQLKANLAFLANPYVAVGAAVVGITAAFAKYASSLTDDVVPVTESLKNMFLSLGNAQRFARLQAESYTKFLSDRQIAETERAIAVLKAFGEETLDLEIQNAEKRLSLLKKGEEDYDTTLTELLVLRAQRAKLQGEKEEQAREEGRQAKLKEIQEQEALDADIRATNAAQDQFDKGYLDAEAYQAGRNAILGKPEAKPIQEVFAVGDINDEFDPAEQAELDRKVKLGQEILKVQKESDEKLKKARQDMFLNLASIFGAETKLGKAFLVAKQLQNARELILEIGKTISFSAQAGARSTVAIAEGSAQTAKVGFPQNIPLLIGYAAQAAGIISAIRSATSAAGIPTATPAFVPASPGFSPQIVQTIPNVSPVGRDQASQLAEVIGSQQQRPVRAYVVSTDVSTAQQLDRNIVEGASI
jgi:hypothetical protein